ncbi:hypothetical protein HG530_010177 [Fusarium avenaceum]|nr:hypothetical protein HG530_010177 [Fusarium avenaceum]
MAQDRVKPAPQAYTYGWQRATILGAFFNGVFLLALGVSILVQTIERFVHITRIQNPLLILIVGSVGLGLNVLVMSFLHEHDHGNGHKGHGEHGHTDGIQDQEVTESGTNDTTSEDETRSTSITSSHHEHKHKTITVKSPGRDLGMMGVLIHVLGDAINNIGVIIAAVIVWKTKGEGRYYADPAVGVFISIMILLSAIPLVKNSGAILLQTAPRGINLEDIKHDMEKISGVKSVHELHIWRLDQRKSVASAHIVVEGRTIEAFADKAKIIMECLHAYGVHSATLQPEALISSPVTTSDSVAESQTEVALIDANHGTCRSRGGEQKCQLICGSLCEELRCCYRE